MSTEVTIDEANAEPTRTSRMSKRTMIALGAVGSALTFGLLFYLSNEVQPPPEDLFVESLYLLDQGDVRRAGNIARYLQERNYRDINFGGGVDYVLGMSEFALGAKYSVDRHTSLQHYAEAAKHLKIAFDQGLILSRRPRWAYAHGIALYQLNQLAEAEPRLVEALAEYPAGRREIALALADCDLGASVRSPARLTRAINLCDEVLTDPSTSAEDLGVAWLRRAEAVFYADGPEVAEQWINKTTTPETLADDFRLRTIQGRIAAQLGRHDEAVETFQAILNAPSAPPETARRSAFYLGGIYELKGDDESAIQMYRQVVDDYDRGDETSVAAVRLGDLLRLPPRTLYEDALTAYKVAVSIGIDPEKFRNRYASLDDLRDDVRRAWQDWLQIGEHRWSTRLARQMAPLFIKTDAADMAAVATEARAIAAAEKYEAASESERDILEHELRAAWRDSGDAFARLADVQIAQAAYADAVWTSSEHFMRGHDFESALAQTERFLESGTESRRPSAMVNFGVLQMNLHRPGDDRLTQAAEAFERMLANYPTADASFDARYALGECYLELDSPKQAEAQWRNILESKVLSPASLVWQNALVALGDMHFHVGEQLALQSRKATLQGDDEQARTVQRQADAHWKLAVQQLTAYLARAPESHRSATARFWLAKSLQRSIEEPKSRLDQAETSNARMELERQIKATLNHALQEFRSLVDTLGPLAEDDKINELQRRVLRDSQFEIAHTYFLLDDSVAAIDAYNDAVNSYPNDPRVLLAYLQSARCFDQLGRTSDAASQLKRARVIHEQLDPKIFDSTLTSFSSDEWRAFLSRTLELMTEESQADS